MESDIEVKICGITDDDGLAAAIENGADYIGFVFVPGSPRYITPKDAAELATRHREKLRPQGRKLVAVMADPDDAELAEVLTALSPDIIQLHGAEIPARVRQIGGIYDLRLMKALPIANEKDVKRAADYVGYADMLLFDARSEDGTHGGKGKSFDWSLLQGMEIRLPWFLSGGLTPENVADAIRTTHATKVDVSSGVERERGVKDPALIKAFIDAAKGREHAE